MADENTKTDEKQMSVDLTSVINTLITIVLPALIQFLQQVFKNNPTALEQALLSIIQSGVSAYEAQVGKPIDPTLIKPIAPVQ